MAECRNLTVLSCCSASFVRRLIVVFEDTFAIKIIAPIIPSAHVVAGDNAVAKFACVADEIAHSKIGSARVESMLVPKLPLWFCLRTNTINGIIQNQKPIMNLCQKLFACFKFARELSCICCKAGNL